MTMDGNGGCCVGRYATGAYDKSKVDKIMRRFRPIAPKPVVGGTASGDSLLESSDACNTCDRCKRKYVTDYGSFDDNIRCNQRTKYSPEQRGPVVTLSLLPESPDLKGFPAWDLTASAAKEVRNKATKPIWLSFNNCAPQKACAPAIYRYYGTSADQPVETPSQPASRLAGSSVTVECVTETWVGGYVLGSTDEERRSNLSKDTCPGFISDGFGRVTWTNRSYRRMVGQGEKEDEEGEGVQVWLAIKEELVGMRTWRAVVSYPSFTCRVKVQNTCGKENSSLTVPCDVWRMDNGGFAWRLDVKAALSLSLRW